MRTGLSCLAASPSIRFDKKWLVTGTFSLFAMVICLSSHAAVSKPDSSSPTVSRKGKVRKVAQRTGQGTEIDQHWQKKQPFAAMTNHKKRQTPVKQSARLTGQNVYDYRFINQYLPDSGKSRTDDRDRTSVSSVFRQTSDGPASATPSKNASGLINDTRHSGSGINSTNSATGITRFSMNYEKSQDTTGKIARFISGKTTPDIATNNDIVETRQNQSNIQLGMEYATGNGRVNASVNYVRLKDMKGASSVAGATNNDSADLKTIAVGYTYDVSDRTSFYGMVAHTDYEKEAMAGYLRGNGSDEDGVTGVQFGVTHKF